MESSLLFDLSKGILWCIQAEVYCDTVSYCLFCVNFPSIRYRICVFLLCNFNCSVCLNNEVEFFTLIKLRIVFLSMISQYINMRKRFSEKFEISVPFH